MLSACMLEKSSIAGHLQETFFPIAEASHTFSKLLLEFWNERPSDGLIVGRDIPSRKIARLLSHLILWAPIEGGRDYVARHMGETLRARFGGYVVGRRMSELLSPEIFAYHLDSNKRLIAEGNAGLLDVVQSHNGFDYLHYELVVLPATSPDRRDKWIVVGAFYF